MAELTARITLTVPEPDDGTVIQWHVPAGAIPALAAELRERFGEPAIEGPV